MKLDINKAEQDIIVMALDKALASARRQQNSGHSPQIKEVYAAEERNILAVQMKVGDLKGT